ncbi:MAG TPA: hypothetical protein VIT64_07180, partial [Ilumatobacteraceae bacterium]
GVSLGDVPPGFEPIDNPVYELEDVADLPALRDVFGIVPGADGAMLIDRVTPELSSPHGALHIGPINIALEAAAMDELERSTGRRDVQVEHWTVLLVKPGYRGPFRATATVVGGGGRPRLGIEATMTDQGHNGRVIATVSASFRLVR